MKIILTIIQETKRLYALHNNTSFKLVGDLFKERFHDFGPYEDAIVEDQHFLLHSVLSSSLNIGLLTPELVINKANQFANKMMFLLTVWKDF